MRRFLNASLLVLLCGSAQAATIYVDNNGSNTSPYDTCAKAATALGTAVTAWTTSDVIWVNDQHSESSASTLTYAATGDSPSVPVPIYSVDFSDGAGGCSGTDAYTVASAAQVTTTGGADIDFQASVAVYGMYFLSADDLTLSGAGDHESHFYDTTFELTSNGANFYIANNTTQNAFLHGGTINLNSSNGGEVSPHFASHSTFYGVEFLGEGESAGLFRGTGDQHFTCVGCDLAGMTTLNGPLMDASASGEGRAMKFRLIGGSLPASWSATDGNEAGGDMLFLSGVDVVGAGAAVATTELYVEAGTVKTNFSTYRDNGWNDTDGSNLSYAFAATTDTTDGYPLCSWPITAWVNSTGSKTFTLEFAHDFTASPDKSEVWMELLALETTNSTDWTLSRTEDVLGTTAVTSSSETWTGCAGCTTEKISASRTINKAGLWQLQVCTSKYEASKTLWVDPLIDVS